MLINISEWTFLVWCKFCFQTQNIISLRAHTTYYLFISHIISSILQRVKFSGGTGFTKLNVGRNPLNTLCLFSQFPFSCYIKTEEQHGEVKEHGVGVRIFCFWGCLLHWVAHIRHVRVHMLMDDDEGEWDGQRHGRYSSGPGICMRLLGSFQLLVIGYSNETL